MEKELIKSVKLDSEFITLAVVKLMKRDIFERYKQTGELTDEDWEFCEKIDWHPVDELPPKKEHLEKLKIALSEKPVEYNSVEEFFEKIK